MKISKQALATGAGVVAVVVALGVSISLAAADGASSTASCTPNPTVTVNSDGSYGFDAHCDVALKPVVGPTTTITATATATATQTVTVSPSSSAPTVTPTPTPTQTVSQPPAGGVTNGRQVGTDNTGFAAWVGADGSKCSSLKVYPAVVKASALGASVGCAEFQKGISFDQNITVTASKFDASIDTNGHTVNLNWDTISPATVEDICVHGEGSFHLLRSQVSGCSDAVRFDGDSIVESYLRTKAESAQDHNDAVQAYQADAGGSILRSNIDALPVNAAAFGIGAGNGAIFLADSSKGETEIRDNYLQGGGYTLRLNESQHYRVTGNVIAAPGSGDDTWLYGPLSTGNSVTGAFLEWANNALSNGTALAKP